MSLKKKELNVLFITIVVRYIGSVMYCVLVKISIANISLANFVYINVEGKFIYLNVESCLKGKIKSKS